MSYRMKITKTQLKNLIKEEMTRVSESFGMQIETGSELIEFAKAYSSLGNAVQEQVDSIVSAYYNNGEDSDGFKEAVYEANPNAISLAFERLARPLRVLEGKESDVILKALEMAQEIYMQGDDEVEADRQSNEEEL
tara:strand:+ start:888 stop:1295 length:408 start_codon:yes stop_codon:yes gene_type:complete